MTRISKLVRLRRRRFWLIRIVRLAGGFVCTSVVRPLVAPNAAGVALVDFRQHGGIPSVPLRHESIVDVLLAGLETGTLHRVVDDVEEERVVENLQILVVAISGGR